MRVFIISFIITSLFFFSAYANAANLCDTGFIQSEKSLKKVYYTLRSKEKSCNISANDYLSYSDSALLAERFAEALWAAERGLEKVQEESLRQKLTLNRGLAFLGKERSEEAIAVFKELSIKDSANQVNPDTKERAHLALIQAYYQKNGYAVDKNVEFLVNLFFYRYSKSPYTPILSAWCIQNHISVKR